MPNPQNILGMMQQFGNAQQKMNSIAGIVNAARNGGNPMQMIQQMAKSNPQIAQVSSMISGKSEPQLQQMAMNMARERGLDINAIANALGLTIKK